MEGRRGRRRRKKKKMGWIDKTKWRRELIR
jgi:hypothetical protein